MTLAFTHEIRGLNLDQFTSDLHRELAINWSDAEPKVYTIAVDLPVIPAESEMQAIGWHTSGVATWTERQADTWSDGILVYRYATRTDGDRCVVTWPVNS